MCNSFRLLIGVALGAFILLAALYVVPSIGFISSFVNNSSLGSGDVTQLTLLVFSLIFSYFLSGHNLFSYGFRLTRAKNLIRPVLISIASVVLFFVSMNILMAATGLDPVEMGSSGMDKSIPNFLITVALFASISEEIFYRGLIYSFLKPLKIYRLRIRTIEISLPVAICAFMFGLGHLCLLGNMNDLIVISIIVAAISLGLIAGYYREKTGSLLPAIAAHMTFNLVAFGVPTIIMSL